MSRIYICLLLLMFSVSSVSAYYSLATDLETKLVEVGDQSLKFKIYDADDKAKSPYPMGTTLIAKVEKKRPALRFWLDEYWMLQVDQVTLPNGATQSADMRLKLRPRRFIKNPRTLGNEVVGTTALVLGLTIDAFAVGLPISRGGYAVWNSISEVHERQDGASRWKSAAKGFVKGAFYPLPQMLGKAYNLNDLAIGRRVTIDSERRGKSIDATLRPVRDYL